ncbi:MAG: hypothetical protein ACREVL_10315 [Solimonas sp.]
MAHIELEQEKGDAMEEVNAPGAGSFVGIIQAVYQGGYFGLAALIMLVFLVKGWSNVPREFTFIAAGMLVLGAIPMLLPKPAPAVCAKPQISVSLEPANLNQIAYAMSMFDEQFPTPKLLLPGRPQCAGPTVDPGCPRFGEEFEMDADHETVRVSLAEAFDAMQKSLARTRAIVQATSAQGMPGPGT